MESAKMLLFEMQETLNLMMLALKMSTRRVHGKEMQKKDNEEK
jgi:hypothetical protein